MYKRLSVADKKRLIKRFHAGEKATKLCKEAKISRTVFYRWLKAAGASKSLLSKTKKGSRHWRKIPAKVERKVIYYSLKHPKTSVSQISKVTRISTGSVWNILKTKEVSTKIARLQYKKNHGIRIRKELSPLQKQTIITKVLKGEQVTKLSRQEEVSRTIIYKWLSTIRTSGGDFKSLSSRRRRREAHWRYKKAAEKAIEEIVLVHPEYRLSDIAFSLFAYTDNIRMSVSGIYYVLKRLGLNTLEKRFAYVRDQTKLVKQRYQVIEESMYSLEEYSYISSLSPPTQDLNVKLAYARKPRVHKYHDHPSDYVQKSSINFGIESGKIISIGFSMACMLIFFLQVFVKTDFHTINLNNSRPSFSPLHNNNTTIIDSSGAISSVDAIDLRYLSALKKQHIPQPDAVTIPDKREIEFGGTINSWGALAMNTEKGSYSPGEDIPIGFSLIDSKGAAVCDADITLSVTVPSEDTVYKLSSANGLVRESGICINRGVTNIPDYHALFKAKEVEEVYPVQIAVETNAGKRVFSQDVVVKQKNVVSLKRDAYPGRIYPKAVYPVMLSFKPHEDVSGEVIERLPKGLQAESVSGNGVVSHDQAGNTIITWSGDWKKGRSYRLGYALLFPQKSPEVYSIGQLEVRNEEKLLFNEAKRWHIVADSLE